MGLEQLSLWVVDVEGNGAAPPEIVELAMVQVSALELTGTQRHYLVQPTTPISSHVTRIHGITNEDVTAAPTFLDIEDDVGRWLDGAAVVGHNVKVEVEILQRSLLDWSPTRAIDTLRLSRAILPGLASHSLASVGDHLGHTAEARARSGQGHHSALFDATLTALVFIDLARRALEAGRPDLIDEADILRSTQGGLI